MRMMKGDPEERGPERRAGLEPGKVSQGFGVGHSWVHTPAVPGHPGDLAGFLLRMGRSVLLTPTHQAQQALLCDTCYCPGEKGRPGPITGCHLRAREVRGQPGTALSWGLFTTLRLDPSTCLLSLSKSRTSFVPQSPGADR